VFFKVAGIHFYINSASVKRKKTLAEFSTLEVAVFMPRNHHAIKQNCQNLKLKTQPKQLLGNLPLDIALRQKTDLRLIIEA
jgi:hypothetical protein